jgi:hypothetical protein
MQALLVEDLARLYWLKNLLMKLQSTALKREVDEDETPDVPETSPPENDAGPESGWTHGAACVLGGFFQRPG